MPIRDFECSACRAVEEDVLVRRDEAAPPCPACGGERKALVSRFGTVFMGSLRKYSDLKREGADHEGFWVYRRKSSISGQPEPVYLSTFAEVRDFNKAEGLSAPGEVPTNSTISANGKVIKSDGMPGQWGRGGFANTIPSRVWEMDTSPTSITGKDPGPSTNGPPCTVEVADASTMPKYEQMAAEMGK